MKTLLLLLVCCLSVNLIASPQDSIGVKRVANRLFIRHKVVKKETAYSISVKYKTHLDTLYQLNPGMKSLKIGDVVLIPVQEKQDTARISATVEQAHANADAIQASPVLRHRVQPGETLGAIASMYKITPADLTKWNQIRDGRPVAGQWLIVNAAAARLPYLPWNKPTANNQTDTFNLAWDNSWEEITESGLAQTGDRVVVKNFPEGGLISITHLESGKQILLQALPVGDTTFDSECILQLPKETAARLGEMKRERMLVQLKYIVIKP